jgi:Protein of unknown function (DUF1565)
MVNSFCLKRIVASAAALFTSVVLLIALSASHALATTYYVSTSGSNSNSCKSSSSPCRTIQQAVNLVSPGDSIIVASGSYGETVTISTNGTAASPISIAAATEQGASLKNFQLNASYWTINGFNISNQTSGDTVAAGDGIYIHGSDNIVENNYIHELCEEGITPDYGDTTSDSNQILNNRIWRAEMAGIVVAGMNWTVTGNEVWDTQQEPSRSRGIYARCTVRNGADADYLRFFGSGHLINHNYFHDIMGLTTPNPSPHSDCFQTWNDSGNHASNVVVDANWCSYPKQWNNGSSNNDMGEIEDWGGPLQFSNNITINSFHGLITDSTVPNFNFPPLHFFDNTEDNIAEEGIENECYGGGTCTASDFAIVGNIFYEVGSGGDSYYAGFQCPTTIAQNVFHMRSGGVGSYAGNCSPAPVYVNNDPLFTSVGTLTGSQGKASVSGTSMCDNTANYTGISTCANYHLSSNSPAKTNGVNLSGVTTDYYGTSRPAMTPSIGAVQY